jgi:hypothetical protein
LLSDSPLSVGYPLRMRWIAALSIVCLGCAKQDNGEAFRDGYAAGYLDMAKKQPVSPKVFPNDELWEQSKDRLGITGDSL